MVSAALENEILAQLNKLAPEQQRQVLDFARTLARTELRGVPGGELLRFTGTIPPEDLRAMAKAIEEGCERIDPDEW